MFDDVIKFIRENYKEDDFIPLHEPVFFGNEKRYLNECIDSTFVSSVGRFVNQFEAKVAAYTGSRYAIATVNGTAALYVALELVGVEKNTEVITQPLSFIATCNAISYCGAKPIFIDVDMDTMGLSPESLLDFLKVETEQRDGCCYNKGTGKKISAVLPMHAYGHPCRIQEILEICEKHNIPLVEDAAESLGSYYKGKHTGTFGKVGAFSFNGNKIITTGGGGIIVTDDADIAKRAKHITTTAKVPHAYEFVHDEIGYNYRLPNINAAIGCAQMEKLSSILNYKKEIALKYQNFFETHEIAFFMEPSNAQSNFWLNAILLKSKKDRDLFLKSTNSAGVMTRPIWKLMTSLQMYKTCQQSSLFNAHWLQSRVVNIPSGVHL